MKKRYNFLLFLSSIGLVLTAVLCFSSILFEDFNFNAFNAFIDNVNNSSKDDPGLGWYILLAGGASLAVDILTGFAIAILVVFIPVGLQLGVVLLQVLARIFQTGNAKKWKNVTSQVLTIISILVQLLLCYVLILNIISNFDVSNILLFLALALNIASIVLFIKELVKSFKNKS